MEIEKRLCVRLRLGNKHHLRKPADRKAQISSVSGTNAFLISQVVFIPQAQPHAQSLFLFPIVFGINLIHFFDFFGQKEKRCRRKFDRLLCCFDPLSNMPFDVMTVRRMRTVSKSATFLATESVNSAPFKRGETEVQIFWQGKAQNSSPLLRCTFLARRSAKLIANFSATMVTSLPSFSLSLYLSLSPNVPHAQHRKRFRASYNSRAWARGCSSWPKKKINFTAITSTFDCHSCQAQQSNVLVSDTKKGGFVIVYFFVCLLFILGGKLNRQNCLLKEVLREREEKEEKEKKESN